MAVSHETLRLIDGLRIVIGGHVDAAAADLVHAWARAWTEVAREWDAAIAELVEQADAGRWPSRAQIFRAERAQAALAVTRERLDALAEELPVRVLQDVPNLAGIAGQWQAHLMASQLPHTAGPLAAVVAGFNRLDQHALDQIVARTTQRITALARPLSPQADAAMRAVLVRGVAVGENPRGAAARMLARVEGAFNGGRNRALVIARTEMLDAHRAASRANDRANKDVLRGWQWVAQLDKRTCPSCWAQHGSEHGLDEQGPQDHQQGRCVGVPLTKTWRELGFAIDEPASVIPNAQRAFAGLPAADQLAVMGRERLELLKAGKISWDDLSSRRTTAGWRDSFAPTRTAVLRRRAAA